jgi:hypothetical protein
MNLVADAAELGCAVEILEKGLFMERRLGLDQLLIDPL